MSSFKKLSREMWEDSLSDIVLDWVHEAGNPFFDWFWKGGGPARLNVKRRMENPASEIALGRVEIFFERDEAIGGYIALTGRELAVCRKADLLRALNVSRAERAEFATRIKMAQGLFGLPEYGEFYLSKIGVLGSKRGEGVGRTIVDRYLEEGVQRGCSHYCLDVWSGNIPAIKIYRSIGFEVEKETKFPSLNGSYLYMKWQA